MYTWKTICLTFILILPYINFPLPVTIEYAWQWWNYVKVSWLRTGNFGCFLKPNTCLSNSNACVAINYLQRTAYFTLLCITVIITHGVISEKKINVMFTNTEFNFGHISYNISITLSTTEDVIRRKIYWQFNSFLSFSPGLS